MMVNCRRYVVLLALVIVMAAGCDVVAPPTITPTRPLSGPTLAPTDFAIPAPPSEVPGSYYDTHGASDPTVAAMPNDLELPPLAVTSGADSRAQTVAITLAGGTLTADLYDTVPVRAPGVLLLSERRAAWGTFPQMLEDMGYVALVVETPPTQDTATFGAVLTSFSELGQSDASRLDPGRLIVIGEQASANLALAGCAADLRCDALALISPLPQDGAFLTLTQYGERPLLIAASQDDPANLRFAEGLAAGALGEVLMQPFTGAGQGAAILQSRPDFADLIVSWLNHHFTV